MGMVTSRSWLLALPLLTALSGGLGALSGSFEGDNVAPPWQAGPQNVVVPVPQIAPRSPPPPSDEGESTVAVTEQNSSNTGS